MDIALARSKLERLQRAACIMITGIMRTTPTKVLEMLLDLPIFRMAMESAVLMAAYRLPWPDKKNLGIGHNRIWVKVDKVDSKFSMMKEPAMPTSEEWGETPQSTEKKACLVYRRSL